MAASVPDRTCVPDGKGGIMFRKAGENWVRRPYFEYYMNKIRCRYNVNYELDVTDMVRRIRKAGLRFYPSMLYVVSRGVNMNPEFRMSLDADGEPGFWDEINPSYTIFHDDDKTFSDIWSEYDPRFSVFYARVVEDMTRYRDVKGISAKPGRPENCCPMTSAPWLSFSAYSNDTYSESQMLFPIITFARFFERDGVIRLPFSVFVHHAAADGYHTCKLINDIQALLLELSWLES